MVNHNDFAVGRRIRLIETMKNPGSSWLPEEDVPVGTEGTIVYAQIIGNKVIDQITVKWDNGRTLGLLPYQDKYEVI